MTTTTPDLAPQAAAVSRLVAGVRDDQLPDPTPCADTPVAGLLDHLVGLTLAFRLAAEKSPLPGAASASAADLAPDWRERLPRQLQELVAAWRSPAAWEGNALAGGVQLPAAAMGVVALNEVLVHGWDLAVATGQPYDVDGAAAAACLRFTVDFAAGAPEARAGMYGPVVPVPDDAPVLDRLLGQTGRNPSWRP
ncbi:MAG: hypothetical protein JWQ26_189 [Modestobacter sp.]|jgi:uncharacterized protein (TIGR03086 family)|nr:hypothetical protein [Modestobacter sp.]